MPFLDFTLGAAVVGMLAAAILYGITSVQTFLYFHGYKEDTILVKGMVFSLWIFDTLHLIFICHGIYFYTVTSFGNFEALLLPTWTIVAQIYLTNIIDFIVRGFFARRVHILCRGKRKQVVWGLPTIITIISLGSFVLGFDFASRLSILGSYSKINEVAGMLYASFGCTVAADTFIAASLCTILLKKRTGLKRTDSILTVLMAFSINTGLLTSICAAACLITYAIWPDRFIFIGIYFALSKLYINALLASLNARSVIRSSDELIWEAGLDMSLCFLEYKSHRTLLLSRGKAQTSSTHDPGVSGSTSNNSFEGRCRRLTV